MKFSKFLILKKLLKFDAKFEKFSVSIIQPSNFCNLEKY